MEKVSFLFHQQLHKETQNTSQSLITSHIYYLISIPAPSNRSPPATFKPVEATISETCWKVLVEVVPLQTRGRRSTLVVRSFSGAGRSVAGGPGTDHARSLEQSCRTGSSGRRNGRSSTRRFTGNLDALKIYIRIIYIYRIIYVIIRPVFNLLLTCLDNLVQNVSSRNTLQRLFRRSPPPSTLRVLPAPPRSRRPCGC